MLEFFRRLTGSSTLQEKAVFGNAVQTRVYEAGVELMQKAEARYRSDIRLLGGSICDNGLFESKLFGADFALGAMILAFGEPLKKDTEEVYAALLKEASRNIPLSKDEMRIKSGEILREHSRALHSEMSAIGSGRYALAMIYLEAVRASVKLSNEQPPPITLLLEEILAEVTGTY